MKIITVDSFFDNFENIQNAFKEITLYNLKTYNKKFNKKDTWPGFRSDEISKINPFLFNLILKEIFNKFKIPFFNNRIKMSSTVHLRLSNSEEDWIHTDDQWQKTLIIYLSETNFNSGTCFYENNSDIPSTTVNFIQNRALLYDGNIRHMSLSNYGNSIHNGRLTLNCFINSEYYGG
jgi:hypothetical protein